MTAVNFGEKYSNARGRLFERMCDLGWHGWHELEQLAGIRFGARIRELKRLGFQFETRADGEDGQAYRLLSTTPGPPEAKRVKVLLSEFDAEAIARGTITVETQRVLDAALASFKANRGRL